MVEFKGTADGQQRGSFSLTMSGSDARVPKGYDSRGISCQSAIRNLLATGEAPGFEFFDPPVPAAILRSTQHESRDSGKKKAKAQKFHGRQGDGVC